MADLEDHADWTGINIKRSVVCGKPNRKKGPSMLELTVDGVVYATEGEAILARLLAKLGIAFTPNVRICLKTPDDAKRPEVLYVPDFIFDRQAYVWRNDDGTKEVIHGIECKGEHRREATAKGRGRDKVRLLRQQRGINVKILSTDEIRVFAQAGALPMKLL